MTNVYHESDQQVNRFAEPKSVNFQGQAQSLSPPFMKGCCCFSLRTGCLIFGWLGFFSSVVYAFRGGIFLVNDGDYQVTKEIKKNSASDNDHSKIIEEVPTTELLLAMIVASVIFAVCYMVLLIGIYRKKNILLKIFQIFMSGILVLIFIGLLIILMNGDINVILVVSQIVNYIWIIFNILVVHCYQRELQIDLMRTPVIHSAPPRYEP